MDYDHVRTPDDGGRPFPDDRLIAVARGPARNDNAASPPARGGPSRDGRQRHRQSTRGYALGSKQELDRFLAGVERRAFRMAEMATGNTDDALDILQDAMFKLVQKYADKAPGEWGPLFQTILQSRIRDYYRLNRVRNRFRVWFGGEEDDPDPVQTAADPAGRRPEEEVDATRGVARLDEAVRVLPLRQQQAFMLRALEGLDVASTARVMGCSEGSVKTHYSRAIHTLRGKLSDFEP